MPRARAAPARLKPPRPTPRTCNHQREEELAHTPRAAARLHEEWEGLSACTEAPKVELEDSKKYECKVRVEE